MLAWWCRALKDEIGRVTGAFSSARDITERERTAEASWKSERNFRETVKNLDEGFYSCTMAGLLLEHNDAFNRILGFDIALAFERSKIAQLLAVSAQSLREQTRTGRVPRNQGDGRNRIII